MGELMNSLKIKTIKTANNKLEIMFECKGSIKKFFKTNRFYVKYNNCNIENVPEQILTIPFLSAVCTTAWANNTEIQIDTIDETFLHSLEKVSTTLQKFYPKMTFVNIIDTRKIIKTETRNITSPAMMLFSGGIDSLTTFIRHKTETPIIVMIHGSDIPADNFDSWKKRLEYVTKFAKENNLQLRTIQSNFNDIKDTLMFTSYSKLIGGSWYEKVSHGLELLSLCAPLTYIDNIKKIYIASTHRVQEYIPHGSAPEIIKDVAWNNTNCINDGYELTRQQKIQNIANFIKQNSSNWPIFVCNSGMGYNCSSSSCEKCSRTIIGLELAGINPNKHGFKTYPDMFQEIKENLIHNWNLRPDLLSIWKDMQEHAEFAEDIPDSAAKELIDFLKKTELKLKVQRKNKKDQFNSLFVYLYAYAPKIIHDAYRKIYINYLQRKIC